MEVVYPQFPDDDVAVVQPDADVDDQFLADGRDDRGGDDPREIGHLALEGVDGRRKTFLLGRRRQKLACRIEVKQSFKALVCLKEVAQDPTVPKRVVAGDAGGE